MSLTKLAVRGATWMTATTAISALLQIAYTATMSRLLEPRDFGVVAAGLLVVRLTEVLGRSGIQNAVVQRLELDSAAESWAFLYAIALGLLATTLVVIGAPLVSLVSREPDAPGVARVIAFMILFAAFGSVGEGLLRRRLDFKRIAIARVIAEIVGFVVGIWLAANDGGAKSLAAAYVVQAAVLSSIMLLVTRHGMRPRSLRRSDRDLMRFGFRSSAIGYVEFLSVSLDTLAVGRWVGSAGLGQYSRATMLVQLPLDRVSGVMSRVMLSAMSAVQSDRERLARAHAVTVSAYSLVLVPLAGMAAVAAPALVSVVLGSGWDAAARVLPFVAGAATLGILVIPTAVAVEAIGKLQLKMSIQLVHLAVVAGGVALAVISGPELWKFGSAWLAGELVRWLLYQRKMASYFGLHLAEAVRPVAEALVIAAIASGPLYFVVRIGGSRTFQGLAFGSLAGGLLAVAFLAVVRRSLSTVRGLRVALATLQSDRPADL